MQALKVCCLALATSFATGADAQISDGVIRIGVMNDMSSLYADIGGPWVRGGRPLAVEDFGAAKKGMKVEIISADHQNKPDAVKKEFPATRVIVISAGGPKRKIDYLPPG